MTRVTTIGETLRDVRQYYDKRCNASKKSRSDPCENLQLKLSAEADVRYIRRVNTVPHNHSVVLFTVEMIEFIERHCDRATNTSPNRCGHSL